MNQLWALANPMDLSLNRVVKEFTLAVDSVEGLQKVAKLISYAALIWFGPDRFPVINKISTMKADLNKVDTMADSFALFGSDGIDSVVSGRYKSKGWISTISNLSFLTANIGGALLFVQEFICDLGPVASAIGAKRIFGYKPFALVTATPLVSLLSGICIVGYACLAIHTLSSPEEEKAQDISRLKAEVKNAEEGWGGAKTALEAAEKKGSGVPDDLVLKKESAEQRFVGSKQILKTAREEVYAEKLKRVAMVSWSIAEIALKILLLAGCTNYIVLGTAGFTATYLGIRATVG